MNSEEREIVSTREFAAPRTAVFDAFADPRQLPQWWGPKGFTCTLPEFDFRPSGRCRLILHGPDGAAYQNEKRFVEIMRPERIVFDHLQPRHDFQMTMIFAEESGKTRLTWRMLFDSTAEVSKLRNLISEANEQNFDRLAAHLAKLP